MPRTARKRSESGYYHVLIRGIGKQNIFEDDEDRQRFIDTLQRYKNELKFGIHAYCLMGNQICQGDGSIDNTLFKVVSNYVPLTHILIMQKQALMNLGMHLVLVICMIINI